MTKQRSEYLYELVGIIKQRKEPDNKIRKGYRLIVELTGGKEKSVPFIQVWKDLLTNQQIWKAIDNKQYFDKKYIFHCQNWMGQYRLINWKELKTHE